MKQDITLGRACKRGVCGALIILVCGLLCVGGCTKRPPIEQFVNKMVTDVVGPAVRKGLEHGVRSLTMQAGAQTVNPTYVVEFDGKWVVGIEGRATVGVEGVSGQIQVSSESDDETSASAGQQTPGRRGRLPPINDGLQAPKRPEGVSLGGA